MQTQEVAAVEKSRQTQEACRMIHLFDFGKFISAFDWSVWLLERCGVDLRQCLVKNNSFGGQVIRVGFPNKPDSWQKYTPNFIVRDNSSTEKHIIWNLPDTAFSPDETPEVMKRKYDEWFATRTPELAEKNKANDAERQKRPAAPVVQQVPLGQPQTSAPAFTQSAPPPTANPKAESLFDVLRNMSRFDIDGHTAREAQEFLRKEQDDIRRLYGL